jgi:glycosyltransferase involved in cell wall biosynthesis
VQAPERIAERRRLGILTEEFGAFSTIFVQRQLDALSALAPFVCCWIRSNPEIFNYEPVHVLRSGSLRHRVQRKAMALLPQRYRFVDRIQAGRELERCLDRYQPDCMHIHFGWAAARVGTVLRRRGIPYTVVLHGSDLNQACRYPHLPYARRLVEALRGAHRCLFVSKDLLEKGLALGCPEDKGEVFYLGVPVPEERARLDNTDTVRVVCNGRQIEWKGHRILLQAFERLLRAGVDTSLTLIGEGPLRGDLKRQAKGLGIAHAVHFTGALSNSEVYATLRRAHIFAHPSRSLPDGQEEGLGLAVQEAMAVGLPVVATCTGGIPESVVDGETGWLVPHSDPEAMAESLRRLAANPQQRSQMGAAGRQRIEQHFNLDRQNERLVCLLEQLMLESSA